MKPNNGMPRSVVTISDVARAAGVATSTVSRALTKPDRVSTDMRLRIEEIAEKMGYRPNPQARSLTLGNTNALALLIPDLTNPYFFDLIRGTQAEARARGYRHMLIDTEYSAENEMAILADLRGSVDGVVLAGSRLSDKHLAAVAEYMPLVLVNREIDGLGSVVVDTTTAVTQALEYLVSLGHRHVAFLAGQDGLWSSERRWEALRREAARLEVDCVRLGPFSDMRSGLAAADALLHNGATAGLFFNDMLAIGAMRRFVELGVRVPDDLSVIGCDDIHMADYYNPPLTTLTAPVAEMARTATDMLLTRLLGLPGPRQRKLSASLTVRRSAGPVPAMKE